MSVIDGIGNRQQPLRCIVIGDDASVSIFANFNKTVVIVVKMYFVTIGKDSGKTLHAIGVSAINILRGDIVSAVFYTIGNSLDAFLCTV